MLKGRSIGFIVLVSLLLIGATVWAAGPVATMPKATTTAPTTVKPVLIKPSVTPSAGENVMSVTKRQAIQATRGTRVLVINSVTPSQVMLTAGSKSTVMFKGEGLDRVTSVQVGVNANGHMTRVPGLDARIMGRDPRQLLVDILPVMGGQLGTSGLPAGIGPIGSGSLLFGIKGVTNPITLPTGIVGLGFSGGRSPGLPGVPSGSTRTSVGQPGLIGGQSNPNLNKPGPGSVASGSGTWSGAQWSSDQQSSSGTQKITQFEVYSNDGTTTTVSSHVENGHDYQDVNSTDSNGNTSWSTSVDGKEVAGGTSTGGTSTGGTSTEGTSTEGTSKGGTSTEGTSTGGTSTGGTSTGGTSSGTSSSGSGTSSGGDSSGEGGSSPAGDYTQGDGDESVASQLEPTGNTRPRVTDKPLTTGRPNKGNVDPAPDSTNQSTTGTTSVGTVRKDMQFKGLKGDQLDPTSGGSTYMRMRPTKQLPPDKGNVDPKPQ